MVLKGLSNFMKSKPPGLTSSLAIGEFVKSMLDRP